VSLSRLQTCKTIWSHLDFC